jgi:xanthine dehydrogenase small subunit
VEKFLTGYRRTALAAGEFIESVRLPRLGPGQNFFAYKLSKRFDQDISAVVAAFRIVLADGAVKGLRAAFGGMAAVAKRAQALEAALIGQPWAAATLADVERILQQDFSPMDDHRGSAGYRLRAAANLLRRFQLETGSADGGALPPLRVEAL